MALTHGCRDMDGQTLMRLHEKANGWAAGLVLLLRSRESLTVIGPAAETPAMLFDYFAQEILSGTEGVVRDFLLKTSFFSSMTISMAQRLTGNKDAHAILSRLCREHYFLESYAGHKTFYQYHPLFREFLCRVAVDRYTKEEMIRIKLRAADVLVEHGHFDDAAGILREVGDHERADRPDSVPGQGHDLERPPHAAARMVCPPFRRNGCRGPLALLLAGGLSPSLRCGGE